MVELQRKPTTNGAVGEAVWVDAMRRAGLSEEEIDRVLTANATLDRPTNYNGDGRELVPVKEAAHRIGRSENTVRSWIRLGHLQTVDRPPPPEHANGPWVHVDMAEAEELNQRSADSEFVTLTEAAAQFGIPVGRLQGWYKRGILTIRGRRKGPGRAGGAVLVDPAEVAALVVDPPRRTGRPRHK